MISLNTERGIDLTNIAKFTQIRPATSMSLPEIIARHVVIVEGLTGVAFADTRNLAFVERQKQARTHLMSAIFVQRAAATTRFLNREVPEVEMTGTGLLAVPEATVCRTANILTWIDRVASIAPSQLTGATIGTTALNDLQFPAIWRADLLALLILPGLYPDYRRFLAMLLRVCTIVAREQSVGAGAIDFAQQLVDGQPSPGSLLARILAARLLFPSWIVADMTGATTLPSTGVGQAGLAELAPLAVGVEAAQIPANLSPGAMQPAVLDLAMLPKISGINAALASAKTTASKPQMVPIVANGPAIMATDSAKGGQHNG